MMGIWVFVENSTIAEYLQVSTIKFGRQKNTFYPNMHTCSSPKVPFLSGITATQQVVQGRDQGDTPASAFHALHHTAKPPGLPFLLLHFSRPARLTASPHHLF